MLEEMSAFFEARLAGYDTHMMTNIDSAGEFYPFTARCIPMDEGAKVLDLGCGTGLELHWILDRNPTARVTGIDLSRGMLDALREKFPRHDLTLICGSYFDVPFGEAIYDGAVSVESLHHFTAEEKLGLYRRLRAALKDGASFILTDYFSLSDEEEALHRRELLRLKAEEGISDDRLFHYDTPLTVEHERQTLLSAGFSRVEVLNRWGATYTLKAEK